jgi:hypothetical protein
MRVREAGKRLGLSNGCNGTTVSRWEAGEVPQPRMLRCLEEALGMAADVLGFGNGGPVPDASWLAPPGFAASALGGP